MVPSNFFKPFDQIQNLAPFISITEKVTMVTGPLHSLPRKAGHSGQSEKRTADRASDLLIVRSAMAIRPRCPGPNRMQLTSPTEFAKQKVLAVQDLHLGWPCKSVAKPVSQAPVFWRYGAAGRPDRRDPCDRRADGLSFTGGVLACRPPNTLKRFRIHYPIGIN